MLRELFHGGLERMRMRYFINFFSKESKLYKIVYNKFLYNRFLIRALR